MKPIWLLFLLETDATILEPVVVIVIGDWFESVLVNISMATIRNDLKRPHSYHENGLGKSQMKLPCIRLT